MTEPTSSASKPAKESNNSNNHHNHNNRHHHITSDILDDLSSRFIINVPIEERSNFIRICFQIELAHWFYVDYYCCDAAGNPSGKTQLAFGMKPFALQIFNHIPFLKEHVHRLPDILAEFKQYKMAVPTYGAIMMTSDQKRVLLVQSYLSKCSWGFPKGKVNEAEDPMHCAIREVYEETGFDVSKLIRPDAYIEAVLNYQVTRLYIVPDVPADTVFVPRTRMEIRSCTWFQLDQLPAHKLDPVSKEKIGIAANSFFMILPFVKRLKRWVAEQRGSSLATGTNGARSSTKNGGQQRSRQRHKSLGDLDGIKTTPASNNGSNGTAQKKTPAPANLTNTNPITILTSTASTGATTTTTATAAKPGNFKRQLFTLQQQQQNGTAAGSTAVAVTASAHHSNPLAVAQRVSGLQHTTPSTASSTPSASAASTKTPSPTTAERAANRDRARQKKRRPVTAFLAGLNGDPHVQQWKQFAFVDRAALLAPWG